MTTAKGKDPAETTAACIEAVQAYQRARAEALAAGDDLPDPAALQAAAQAHVDASRDLADVKAEYDALQKARFEDGEDVDQVAYQALAHELARLREATENVAGNLPGSPHTATAGIGA